MKTVFLTDKTRTESIGGFINSLVINSGKPGVILIDTQDTVVSNAFCINNKYYFNHIIFEPSTETYSYDIQASLDSTTYYTIDSGTGNITTDLVIFSVDKYIVYPMKIDITTASGTDITVNIGLGIKDE